MPTHHSNLGSLLRRLLEALDGEVEQAYRRAGLDFRPRFTPVMRLLFADGPLRIRDLAERTGLSHSALSQTVTQLRAGGWVLLAPGADRREKFVHPTAKAEAAAPALERQWRATAAAAASLDAELPHDLEPIIAAALEALQRRPFGERIRAAEMDGEPPARGPLGRRRRP